MINGKESTQKLLDFFQRFQHSHVPYNWKEDMGLRHWTERQRDKKNQLNEEELRKLEKVDFQWREKRFPGLGSKKLVDEKKWMEKYDLLQVYYKQHGHTNVKISDNNKQLFNWVLVQRRFNVKGKLLEHRKQLLDKLDFVWKGNKNRFDKFEQLWMDNYKKLTIFQTNNGHLDLPRIGQFESLRKWLSAQKKEYNTGKLKPDRQHLLEKLGLKWTNLENEWLIKYKELKIFRQTNGHCRVKKSWNAKLYSWVSNQRVAYKNGKMEVHRLKLLEEINFYMGSLGLL